MAYWWSHSKKPLDGTPQNGHPEMYPLESAPLKGDYLLVKVFVLLVSLRLPFCDVINSGELGHKN